MIAPPKHLRRPLDIFRHMISDFVRYRKLVVAKYPDLDLQHADIISCILKQLHDDCKKYLLLHGSLTTLEQLERGLVFYDEQLRVLNFHKEASHAKGFAAFGADQPDKGKGKGKGKDHGKDGEEKGKGKGKDKGKSKDKGAKGGGKKGGGKNSRARSASAAGKKKPGTCNYCRKPGHWANECRKRIADEKAAATAASATAESTQSKAAPPPAPPTLSPAPSGKGAGKIGKAALLMSSVLPAAGFCPDTPDRSQFFTMTAMIFSIFICVSLALLIGRLVACLGSSRQSCFACACVAVAVALAACAPRPQSESRLPVLCPTLALPAVTCQDPTYILLDSGGSVHMLSEDTIGVTARISREIPVEALELA